MDADIDEGDVLDQQLEAKYLTAIEMLVAGRIKQIGPEESEALISLRKEFLRRNMTISEMYA